MIMKNKGLLYHTLKFLIRKCLVFYLSCIILTISSYLSGQATGDPKEDFLYGEFYVAQGMYHEALPFYLSTLATDSDNCNLNYRIGLCYSKLIGEQEHALPYLKKAVLDVNPNYMEGKYKSNSSPVESWLLLGDAFHRANELTQASYAYYKYLELIGNSDEERVLMVKKKIAGLGISYEFQRTEKHIKMVNMGSVINSRFSDYNPVLNGDQTILIYTQFWESFDKIMMSHKKDNTWSVPEDITSQIGSDGDCYTSSLSFNGNELYLIRYGDNNYDIYVSKFLNGKWTKMKPISGKINTKHQESSVCVSADGSYLYFSSDKPGGEGGFDIYMARKEGSSWVDIKNLGKTINTKKNEEAPYITSDGTILFFSSNGHETIGNMDILYSEINNAGEWQEPRNIGSPINTTNDDLFYIYFTNTQTGYFSRDLPEGFGKNDIYMIVNENVKDLPIGSFQIENEIGSKLDTRTYSDKSIINSPDNTRKDSVHALRRLPSPESSSNSINTPVNSASVAPVIPVATAPDMATSSNSKQHLNNQNDNEKKEKDSLSLYSAIIITPEPEPGKKKINSHSDSSSVKGKTRNDTNSLMADKEKENDKIVTADQNVLLNDTDTIPIYTIQILALKHPLKSSKIKISPLKISLGQDGFHRYTINEYKGWSAALSELERIRNNGFPDAFIRNINTVENYSKGRYVRKPVRK